MNRTRHLVRVGYPQLSLYNTIRLAECFAGIDGGLEERIAFIRDWASAPERRQQAEIQKFLFQSLQLNNKSFGRRWRKMEERIKEIHEYACQVKDMTDKERFTSAMKDLQSAGFLVKHCPGDELKLELSRPEAKQLMNVGAIALREDETKIFEQEQWLGDSTVMINPIMYKASPYLALLDALQIAGLTIVSNERYTEGNLLKVEVGTSQNSEFKKLLENVPVPVMYS